jgi:hypothetical protein
MTFTPVSTDKLTLEFSGEMFEQPQAVSLARVDETRYADAATAYGVSAIERGLAMWKAGGGKKYPPPKEVTPTGMLSGMIRWPNNLFAGRPMEPGESKGDYTYKLVAGGKKYSLIGHLSDGGTEGSDAADDGTAGRPDQPCRILSISRCISSSVMARFPRP